MCLFYSKHSFQQIQLYCEFSSRVCSLSTVTFLSEILIPTNSTLLSIFCQNLFCLTPHSASPPVSETQANFSFPCLLNSIIRPTIIKESAKIANRCTYGFNTKPISRAPTTNISKKNRISYRKWGKKLDLYWISLNLTWSQGHTCIHELIDFTSLIVKNIPHLDWQSADNSIS